ncbi:hydroxymethylglutaryl-CoA lyase [Sphingobium terrigena]|uniref:Hydroxymethylglutaryl-CoA lyase n=1 Tax=Sphingobium terrigena TaxID=2304063 RepID=A0A418YXQ4_9SPHN|nr:hydroxymethylglutaryl-CoA lyase [Sphingobium terrigena]RJG57661.1 hydroxymethylglutaryl-CoA lyase [Sphingobium terrigena]
MVQIVEVGPRDGLQNEKRLLSTADKILLIARLIEAGAKRIEVASFVNPKRVPQMADAEAVVQGLPATSDCSYIGLVLNRRGAERALTVPVDELGMAVPGSETFGIRNQGQSAMEAIAQLKDIVDLARGSGVTVHASVSLAFGCPFEGQVPVEHVVDLAKRIADLDVTEIGMADTIGIAVPAQVTDLFGRLREAIPHRRLRAHFHDTRNTGIANVWAAVQAGVDVIDASVGGLGGCPFAPGATGNVPTEDVCYLLESSGVATGLALDRLVDTAHWINGLLGRAPTSGLSRSMCEQV